MLFIPDAIVHLNFKATIDIIWEFDKTGISCTFRWILNINLVTDQLSRLNKAVLTNNLNGGIPGMARLDFPLL